MSSFFDFNTDFESYGFQHIIAIILTFGISIVLPLLFKQFLNKKQHLYFSRILAILIACWVIFYDFILLYLGKFDHKTDLPLDICNLMGLLLPLLMWYPNQKYFIYFYFYTMAGTTQAIFNPHLIDGFPSFVFIKFWMVHAGLIIYVLYVAVIWEFQIRFKDLWYSFLVFQLYILTSWIINSAIRSNYMYLVQKPPTPSIVDYFGPWPYYILVGEFIFLFISFLIYLPYMNTGTNLN